MKTKVFFDALPLATDKVSGIGHLLAETVRALSQETSFTARFEIILIIPKSAQHKMDIWGFQNVTYRSLPTKGRIWSALILYRLLPPADLFFGWGVYVFANYTTWPLARSKAVTYIHDLNYLVNPETVKPKTRQVLGKNIPRWLDRADRVLTISEFSKQEIVKYFPRVADNIRVALCGVDRSVFNENVTLSEHVRNTYQLPDRYFLFLSNVEPRKNVMRLLGAYKTFIDDTKFDDTKSKIGLVLVGGEGWLNEDIVAKINQLRAQRYVVVWPKEYVPDAHRPEIIAGSVAPALYEGFGIPPLEAMASGRPVILSNATSLPEVAGDVGLYVDPLDESTIVRQMKYVAAMSPKDHAELCKKSIARSKMFTWQKSAKVLAQAVCELIE
jgi:glycosyltransferase involved in cell wall biosynthesis